MKKHYQISLVALLLCGTTVQAQQKYPEYLGKESKATLAKIEQNMSSWDGGTQTYNSVLGIASNNKNTTGTNRPTEATAVEHLTRVPETDRKEVVEIVNNHVHTPTTGSDKFPNPNTRPVLNEQEVVFWNIFDKIICRPNTQVHIGKTYGDPHMQTFDGHRYEFQTVGEFTLCRSNDGNFEIQTRQKAMSESVSLNTAAAMNVNGDKVAVYAQGFPDALTEFPIRVNGVALRKTSGSHPLNNGGIIRITGNKVKVSWPTGEQVAINLRKGKNPFMNVVPQVYTSKGTEYSGLLGNANGNPNDDLRVQEGKLFKTAEPFYALSEVMGDDAVKKSAQRSEKLYQIRMAKEFGNSWRISQLTSLFDYAPGESTETFTDRSFPSEYHSLAKMDKNEVRKAKKTCEKAGITGPELRGCITDVATTKDDEFATSMSDLVDDQKLVKEEFGSKNEMKPLMAQKVDKKEFTNRAPSMKETKKPAASKEGIASTGATSKGGGTSKEIATETTSKETKKEPTFGGKLLRGLGEAVSSGGISTGSSTPSTKAPSTTTTKQPSTKTPSTSTPSTTKTPASSTKKGNR
jgi:hypothetical protein